MVDWLGVGSEALAEFVQEMGQPAYRAKQLREWLHTHRVADTGAMKNLPASLRSAVDAAGPVRRLAELERRDADDGLTSKWLYALPGGDALIETVLIVEKQLRRRTVCVSSMAGCPLGCVFCATGGIGFVRDLSAGEIVEQVYRVDVAARERGDGQGVSHVVFMGMGEPLLNLDAVLAAAARFADPEGIGLSGRHITISTAGVPDGIRRLAEAGVNYRLAVSLHAPNQKVREAIMPAAKRWPLPDLFAALREFATVASRDLTFEYCLIDGVNAAPEHARELARLLADFRCKVNLIPYNPTPNDTLTAPPAQAIRRFQHVLEDAGLPVTVRMEKGAEIGAACGQLGAQRKNRASERPGKEVGR